MSSSALMTALLEYVGDVMVNECGLDPGPERVLRYHGARGMPQDCCSEDGYLVASWAREWGSANFPNQARGENGCSALPALQYELRYVVCWPVPPVSTSGVQPIDDRWDEKAAELADVADCVSRALIRLACSTVADDPLRDAVLEQVRCNQFTFVEAVPIDPGGSCAGVLWRVYAGLRSAEGGAS